MARNLRQAQQTDWQADLKELMEKDRLRGTVSKWDIGTLKTIVETCSEQVFTAVLEAIQLYATGRCKIKGPKWLCETRRSMAVLNFLYNISVMWYESQRKRRWKPWCHLRKEYQIWKKWKQHLQRKQECHVMYFRTVTDGKESPPSTANRLASRF